MAAPSAPWVASWPGRPGPPYILSPTSIGGSGCLRYLVRPDGARQVRRDTSRPPLHSSPPPWRGGGVERQAVFWAKQRSGFSLFPLGWPPHHVAPPSPPP